MIEYLWGTSWTSQGGQTVTNGQNMVDSAFNDLVADVQIENIGTVTWDIFDDTVVTVDADLDYVHLDVRFYSPGLGGGVVNLEVYDGATWTVLATYSNANPMPTALTTVPFDVNTIFDTVAKINACQVRWNITTKKNNQHIYVDEARVTVTSKNKVNVFDSVLAEEFTSLLVYPLFLSVYDESSVEEFVNAYLDTLYVDSFDLANIEESVYLYLDVLNVDILDPFHVLINEHVDVIDLVVEIGIVMDAIDVTDYSEQYLDVLNVSVFDESFLEEWIRVYLESLNIDIFDESSVDDSQVWLQIILYIEAYDDINIEEYVDVLDLVIELGIVYEEINVLRNTQFLMESFVEVFDDSFIQEDDSISITFLYLNVNEEIGIEEFINVLTTEIILDSYDDVNIDEGVNVVNPLIPISLSFEQIGVEEYKNVYLDVLNVQVLDPFHVLITEVSQVLDAILTIGVVTEITELLDIVTLFLDYLYLAVDSQAEVLEAVNLYLPDLFLDVDDESEVEEFVYNFLDVLYIDVSSESVVEESVSVIVFDLYASVYEELILGEESYVVLESLNIDNFDYVEVEESIDVLDKVVELFAYDESQIEEYAEATAYTFVFAYEEIELEENAVLSLNLLYLEVIEEAYAEDYLLYLVLETLLIDEFDSINIEEFIDVLDKVVELYAQDEVQVEEHLFEEVFSGFQRVELIDVEESIFISPEPLLNNQENVLLEESVFLLIPSVDISVVVDDNVQSEESVSVLVPISLSVEEDIGIEEYAFVLDLVIELFAFDSASIADVVITPTGVLIGDDVGVSGGALRDYLSLIEEISVVIPELFHEVSDDISVGEWVFVLDIIVELYSEDFVSILEINYMESLIDKEVFDSVLLQEYTIISYLAELDVIDDITVESIVEALVVAKFLYPRIFTLVPRHRMFKSDKTKYNEEVWV